MTRPSRATLTVLATSVLVVPVVMALLAAPAHGREQHGTGHGRAVDVADTITLHRADRADRAARHVVRYRVEKRGRVTASMSVFRRQVQQTFDDRRGWARSGIEFRRVKRGGTMTVVLSEASRLPSFSSGCSAQWSCRVGRYVVVNQLRWLNASPMWKARDRSLRSYRHMVVNHETGHWLGHGHRGCPGRGDRAPVMMQQSIDLAGCRPNPWPKPAERDVPRF